MSVDERCQMSEAALGVHQASWRVPQIHQLSKDSSSFQHDPTTSITDIEIRAATWFRDLVDPQTGQSRGRIMQDNKIVIISGPVFTKHTFPSCARVEILAVPTVIFLVELGSTVKNQTPALPPPGSLKIALRRRLYVFRIVLHGWNNEPWLSIAEKILELLEKCQFHSSKMVILVIVNGSNILLCTIIFFADNLTAKW